MDNHHVHIGESRISCGVLELSGITSDASKVLFAIGSYLYHPSRGSPAAFIMWSDLPHSNGAHLVEFIKDEVCTANLWVSMPEENPKTGNNIHVFVWKIPHEQLKEWYKKERIRKAGRF